MPADAGDLAAVEHNDLIRMADGADALGDDDFGRIMKLCCQTLAQLRVRAVVQRGEGVVEDQNFRLPRQRAGDGKPLLLPAGNVAAKLCNGVVRAFGELVDELLRLRKRNGVV